VHCRESNQKIVLLLKLRFRWARGESSHLSLFTNFPHWTLSLLLSAHSITTESLRNWNGLRDIRARRTLISIYSNFCLGGNDLHNSVAEMTRTSVLLTDTELKELKSTLNSKGNFILCSNLMLPYPLSSIHLVYDRQCGQVRIM
jgi:hypothetical protein